MAKMLMTGQSLSSDNSYDWKVYILVHISLPKCSNKHRHFQEPMIYVDLIFHFEADSLNVKAICHYKLLKFPKIPHSLGFSGYSLI